MSKELQPHIRCTAKDAAKYAILPGDPGRVDRVRSYLEDVKDIAYNREFKSILGYYKGVKLMVVSTGIGGSSAGIAVEELNNIGVETLIRIGSCGALQEGMRLGELVIANGAVRNEGTSDTYIEKGYPAVPDTKVLMKLIESAEKLNYKYYCGPIRSHDSFYTDDEENIDRFWSQKGILASDMESAPLFVIGRLRGLKTASVLNIVVEKSGNLESDINSYVSLENASSKGEEREILTALETIYRLDNNL
jgi:uridine phosphorylase